MVRMWLSVWLAMCLAVVLASSNGRSPLIQSPKLSNARSISKVDFFMKHAGVEAYSGYITVQEKSHMYFLLLKAPKNASTGAPLIMWLQGGPGKSGLFGQFLENGPVGIDGEGNLYNRSCTFQKDAHMLYVDYPAGGGFSVVESPSVLSKSLDEVTADLRRFLEKFFLLFPEYASTDLYLAGESYGARAAISFALHLREVWKRKRSLNGLILSSGFFVPIEESIFKSHKFLYELGLLNAEDRGQLEKRFKTIIDVAKTNKTSAALFLAQTVGNMKVGRKKSLFKQLTGYDYQGSILHTDEPSQIRKYVELVNSTDMKRDLHVLPYANLDSNRPLIQYILAPNDFFNGITSTVKKVLGSERVLLMYGQMDNVFPPTTFEKFLTKIKWQGSDEYSRAKRKPWKTFAAPSKLAGYVRETEKLVDALVVNAGHSMGLDACDAVYDLVYRFLNNVDYGDSSLSNSERYPQRSC